MCPIINKTFKKVTEKRKYQTKTNNENHKVYNTNIWRKLRLHYLSEHPLCEKCLEKEILTPAVDVHHIREIDNGNNITEKRNIGYDYNNLMALCSECHHNIHKYKIT